MDNGTIIAIAVLVIAVLGGVVVITTARRRDLGDAIGAISTETRRKDTGPVALDETAAPATGREVERAAVVAREAALVPAGERTPVAYIPPDPDALGVTRRQFLNRSIIGTFALSLGGFGGGVLAFLYPTLGGGFGSKIRAGNIDDILSQVDANGEPAYFPEGRFYLNAYPKDAVASAEKVYSASVVEGMKGGVVALYQKCPHLGCRVPWCKTSQWFECPCHGSQYNRVGEKKGGPAPRGMDRFAVSLDGSTVVVDTGAKVDGPPIGTNTTGQEAEGPHCISGGEGGH